MNTYQEHPLCQCCPSNGLMLTSFFSSFFLALLFPSTSLAAPLNDFSLPESDRVLAQVPSVNQLSDVQPTDWAYQALKSLVERYGCISGYPDSTYRGNSTLSRYEFAASLNACLNRITELIASTNNSIQAEDLTVLQRLQTDFGAELATLRGRVNNPNFSR